VISLQFLGGAGTVTGSKFGVQADGRTTLVDCGLFQGPEDVRRRNWELPPVDPVSVGEILLTHAHIDHSGYVPRFRQAGYTGDILATHATKDLLRILLPDSGHLHEEEARYRNEARVTRYRPALPLYTAADGADAAAHVTGVDWEQRVPLGEHGMASFRRAGHILGAASVHLDLHGATGRCRLVFSGDVGRYGAPVVRDPAPLGEADYVVVESTYGDRRHDPTPVDVQLQRALLDAIARGGAIIVPAFAVGRTQDLLYYLDALQRSGRVPRLPAYVDSPMAIDATEIYAAHATELDDEMRSLLRAGASPLRPSGLRFARTTEESRAIGRTDGSVLIVSASGMATGGRVLHHLRRYLPDPRATVILAGYQAVGTRGRALDDGAASVRIFGDDVPVRAHVERLDGLSAHADADGLLRWLRTAARAPRRVFVVHGDPGPAQALAARIEHELGWATMVPQHGESVKLD
jgi:metallo-beta-lactamase family protein